MDVAAIVHLLIISIDVVAYYTIAHHWNLKGYQQKKME